MYASLRHGLSPCAAHRCPRCTFESSLPAAARGQVAGSANTAGMMAEVLGEGGRRGDAGIEGEVVAVLGNYQVGSASQRQGGRG